MHSLQCSRWRHRYWEGAKLSRLRFQNIVLPWKEVALVVAEGLPAQERVGGTGRSGGDRQGDGTKTVPCGTTRLVLPHNNI